MNGTQFQFIFYVILVFAEAFLCTLCSSHRSIINVCTSDTTRLSSLARKFIPIGLRLRWKLKVLAFSWWCDSIYLKMIFKICNWNELSLELSAEAIYSLVTLSFSLIVSTSARVCWRSSVVSFRLHQISKYTKRENDENFWQIRIWIVKQTSWMRHRLEMITNKEEVKLFCRTEQWNRIE